jgi:DNA invertase Pin-like site-specific DNA recombinase
MSTETQQYSISCQVAAIGEYAKENGFEVVRTYSDEARSGLNIEQRPALQALLRDVITGEADFSAILVCDVSRWGGFQDTDESAHYEFLCKRSGIKVHYCAECFANDDSVAASLLKTIKRSMAGEYACELSRKVFAGNC